MDQEPQTPKKRSPDPLRRERYQWRRIKGKPDCCERWKGEDGFRNFLADLGRATDSPQPPPKLSKGCGWQLAKIDEEKPWEPSNTRWEPWGQITYQGRTRTMAQWELAKGLAVKRIRTHTVKGVTVQVEQVVGRGTLRSRLADGWPLDRALEKPVKRRRNRP